MFEFIDRLIAQWEGRTLTPLSRQESMDMIKANLQASMERKEVKVLLTGYGKKVELEELSRKIDVQGISFICGEDICRSAESVLKLADCDGVVLVTKKGKTTTTEVEQEIEKIKEAAKSVYGYIMV